MYSHTNQALPLVARVQKIINADPERLHTSKNGAFAIALATEMFIQHLATTTHNVVKTERKPRRNIQYRDVASAVAKTDNLEFLVDVVPRTITYKEYKKRAEETKKAKEIAKETAGSKNGKIKDAMAGSGASAAPAAGPSSLNPKASLNGHATKAEEMVQEVLVRDSIPSQEVAIEGAVEAMEVDSKEQQQESSEPEEDGPGMQIEMEMRGPRATNGSPEVPMPRRPSGFTAINGAK